MIGSFSQADAVTPSLTAHAEAVETAACFDVPSVMAGPSTMLAPGGASGASSSIHIPATIINKWTAKEDSRLSGLAAAKALRKASDAELIELEQLKQVRRRLKFAQSTDEILFQYRRQQREDSILRELQKYVEFLKAPRNPKT